MAFKTSGASIVRKSSARASGVSVYAGNTNEYILEGRPVEVSDVSIKKVTVTPGSPTTAQTISSGGSTSPTITSLVITDSNWVALDDTAILPTGGNAKVIGTGFQSGAVVYLNGSALTTTFTSSTELRIVVPATSAGTYSLMLFNPDTTGAIYLNLVMSDAPSWITASGNIAAYYETTTISSNVRANTANNDSITYSLYSGSLPTGATLAANGVISGTAPVVANSTTYSFVINATDPQYQNVTRSFNMTINTDVVTWSSPADGTTYEISNDTLISNVSLSATNVVGGNISYSANALPSGLYLTGNVIYGTPSSANSTSTLLTANATTTGRTSTRTINWSVTLPNDAFFKYVTTLLSPTLSTLPFIDDASTNNFAVTIAGDTKPNNFNPYTPGYYSNYFDGTGDYLTIPSGTSQLSTGNFTIETWINIPVNSSIQIIADARGSQSGGIPWQLYTNASGKLLFNLGSNLTGSTTIPVNTWTHVAVVRSGTTITLYVNGVSDGSTTSSADLSGGATCYIGRTFDASGTLYYQGYISNFRVVIGTAVYTTTFTPPTTPLTAIANTSLLTCQSNRFIDNSTNAFTITVNGDTSIKSFQPFTPNSSYASYGSTYFDGTGDYLTIASNAAFGLGTGDFTIEFWAYSTANARQDWIDISDGTNRVLFYYSGTAVTFYGNGAAVITGSAITLNTWVHYALAKSSGSTKMFVNGVQAGSTYATNQNYGSTSSVSIGKDQFGSIYITGYMTDVRVVKGTAVYTSAFTPPTTPLTAIANTQLLTCQTNQPVNNSVFLDNSTNNFAITRNGNTTQGTFSPYGANWSNYFDGNGDYLSMPAISTLATQFTIEFWANFSNADGGRFDFFALGGSAVLYRPTGNTLNWYIGSDRISGSFTLASYGNTWNHIAICRDASNNTRLFVNGTQLGSTYASDNNSYSSSGPTIGWNSGGGYLTGYISNFRIISGTALYTSSFTPPTSPLQSIANTSLLTCQSNNLVDNSPNNFTITKNGDVSVQKFGPFAGTTLPTPYYSGYFDGSGDYLSVADATNLQPGTGDFTYELWWYPTTFAPSYQEILTKGAGVQIYTNSSAGLLVALSASNSGSYFVNTGHANSISGNTWNHIAITRSGNNYYAYLNGTQSSLGTSSSSPDTGTDALIIGAYKGPLYYTTGYISNVRFVKGTAVYTGNFTPSTSPLTAISGTQLLTCQSNTFKDNSTNNYTIIASGDSKPTTVNPFTVSYSTNQSYTPSVFGGSGYFDGSGDYLSIPNNSTFGTLNGDFTIECWFYPTATSFSSGTLFTSRDFNVAQYVPYIVWIESTTITVYMSSNGGSWNIMNGANAGTMKPYQWQHFALVRSGSAIKTYLNGIVQSAAATYSGTFTNTTPLNIGNSPNDTGPYFNGYISNFRLNNGTALYTSNFVPQNAPLTAIQNTSLLTNFTNAAIYDSSEMNIFETVGDTKVSTTTVKYGNTSMYFDGTGDYLTAPFNPGFNFGAGDFTIEFWVNYSSSTAYATALRLGDTWTTGSWSLYLNDSGGSGYPSWWSNTLGSALTTSGALINDGAWHHIALVRYGATMTMYIDGTSRGTLSVSTNSIGDTTTKLWVARDSSNVRELNGYLSDLRITKGIARYTSNFTAPTSALLTK